ncbi:MAG: TIM barrel protein [Sphingomonadales bacterium]|nr:TIM barrel protein [Sphingomonadales bacterium]
MSGQHDPFTKLTRRAFAGMAGAASAFYAMPAIATVPRKADHARFVVNLPMWWTNLPFLQRIDMAARSGFVQAEMWSIGTAADKDPAILRKRATDAGITIIHCTSSLPEMSAATAEQVREAAKLTIENTAQLGALHCTLVGHLIVNDMTPQDRLARYRDNVAIALPYFAEAGIRLLIEPFNPYNHPGYFLYGHKDALAICREIDSPALKINWDLFHMQRAEGNLWDNLKKGADQCGYLQLADSPDRRQPGTGEIDFAFLLRNAQAEGIHVPISLECRPGDGNEGQAIEDVARLARALPPIS